MSLDKDRSDILAFPYIKVGEFRNLLILQGKNLSVYRVTYFQASFVGAFLVAIGLPAILVYIYFGRIVMFSGVSLVFGPIGGAIGAIIGGVIGGLIVRRRAIPKENQFLENPGTTMQTMKFLMKIDLSKVRLQSIVGRRKRPGEFCIETINGGVKIVKGRLLSGKVTAFKYADAQTAFEQLKSCFITNGG